MKENCYTAPILVLYKVYLPTSVPPIMARDIVAAMGAHHLGVSQMTYRKTYAKLLEDLTQEFERVYDEARA